MLKLLEGGLYSAGDEFCRMDSAYFQAKPGFGAIYGISFFHLWEMTQQDWNIIDRAIKP